MADFDWVRARYECSLPRIFERLLSGVESDVDARNEICRKDAENLAFEVSREGNRILVTRSGAQVRSVKFVLRQSGIGVEGEAQFEAEPGFNNPGDCTLTVAGAELELWQIRRRALDKLFYGQRLSPAVVRFSVRPAPPAREQFRFPGIVRIERVVHGVLQLARSAHRAAVIVFRL